MRFHRVFPWDKDAAADAPGGARFAPVTTNNRISNPRLYRELYASSSPEGAIAEALGNLRIWRPRSFRTSPSPLALADLEAHELPIANLAQISLLAEFGVELASDVVSRDRAATQALAARIFSTQRYAGLSWWSYYNPAWTSYGLWETKHLQVLSVEPLGVAHWAVVAAAEALPRALFRR